VHVVLVCTLAGVQVVLVCTLPGRSPSGTPTDAPALTCHTAGVGGRAAGGWQW